MDILTGDFYVVTVDSARLTGARGGRGEGENFVVVVYVGGCDLPMGKQSAAFYAALRCFLGPFSPVQPLRLGAGLRGNLLLYSGKPAKQQ